MTSTLPSGPPTATSVPGPESRPRTAPAEGGTATPDGPRAAAVASDRTAPATSSILTALTDDAPASAAAGPGGDAGSGGVDGDASSAVTQVTRSLAASPAPPGGLAWPPPLAGPGGAVPGVPRNALASPARSSVSPYPGQPAGYPCPPAPGAGLPTMASPYAPARYAAPGGYPGAYPRGWPAVLPPHPAPGQCADAGAHPGYAPPATPDPRGHPGAQPAFGHLAGGAGPMAGAHPSYGLSPYPGPVPDGYPAAASIPGYPVPAWFPGHPGGPPVAGPPWTGTPNGFPGTGHPPGFGQLGAPGAQDGPTWARPGPPAPGTGYGAATPGAAGVSVPGPFGAAPYGGPGAPDGFPGTGHAAGPAWPDVAGRPHTPRALLGARARQYLVDGALCSLAGGVAITLCFLLSLAARAVFGQTAPHAYMAVAVVLTVLQFVLPFGFSWLWQAYWPARHGGQTPAMRWMGLRVVSLAGGQPTLGALSVRWVLLFADGFGGLGMLVASRSPLGQRIGDKAARTVVVRAG